MGKQKGEQWEVDVADTVIRVRHHETRALSPGSRLQRFHQLGGAERCGGATQEGKNECHIIFGKLKVAAVDCHAWG